MALTRVEIPIHVLGLLKGVIEVEDGTRHFGSLMAYEHWFDRAVQLGLVEGDMWSATPTPFGAQVYLRLGLERFTGRAAGWTLPHVVTLERSSASSPAPATPDRGNHSDPPPA